MQALPSKRSNLFGDTFGEPAAKNYDQTTPLLTHSVTAAGTGNWIRTFSFNCGSLRSRKEDKTEPRLL